MGAALSSIGRSVPSRAMRTVWFASPTIVPSRKARRAGFSTGWRVRSLTMRKTSGSGRPSGLGLGPAGQGLGHAVHERDPALGVGADHRVADAGERDPQPLRLLPQRLLGAPRARRMLWAFCRATERSSSSSSSRGRHQPPPRIADASAVPTTRARIFANAVSRVVDVSSQNGEKPQSSVVPSCPTGMYRAASRTRSRTSSGVSTRGSIGETTPTKTRWSGLHVPADDLQDAGAVPLAREGDVEIPDHQLEEAGQQLGVIDVPAVGRVAVAAGAGVHADPLAVLGGEPRQRQVVQVDEAVQQGSRKGRS